MKVLLVQVSEQMAKQVKHRPNVRILCCTVYLKCAG